MYHKDLQLMTITFKIVPLSINTASPTVLQCLERTVEITFVNSVQKHLRFALDLLDGVETATLQPHFQFWKEEKVTRAKSGEYGGCGATVVPV